MKTKTNILTQYQKSFILSQFFKNDEYPGWETIATKLIENEFCMVAGDSCIWVGGIGNFINTNTSDEAVGCLEYRFDLNEFMESRYFIDIAHHYEKALYIKTNNMQTELNEIQSIKFDIHK